MSARSPALLDGEAHLFWVRDELIDDAQLPAYGALLDDTERAREARFLFPRHRRQFRVAHALVRTVLSRYAEVAPEGWRIVADARGRPEVVGPAEGTRLRFNLSHTRGVCACLVADGRDVGVDVEALDHEVDDLLLAQRFFAPREAAALRELAPPERRDAFFRYWTLKESYIKACGEGLAIPLDHFAFTLDPIRLHLDDRRDDRRAWRFTQLRPTEKHLMVAAIDDTGGRETVLRVREAVPLSGDLA